MIRLLMAFVVLAIMDFNDIAKVNALKEKAEDAFLAGDYEMAAQHYSMLLDSMKVEDDRALLNLGHAYYQLNDSTNALSAYRDLSITEDKKLKSIAYQQLGMLNSSDQQLSKALQYFKESIKADPTNEAARYNYELVKKKLKEQQQNQDQQQDQQNQDQENQDEQEQQKDQQKQDQQQNQDQQNQDQQQQDQQQEQQQDQQDQEQQQQQNQEQNQEQQDSEEQSQQEQESQNQEGEQQQQDQPQPGEEGEEQEQSQPQPSPAEKLQEMQLSEEKAQMILEAMRNSEIQYIQQMRKKPTKKPDSKKPDW